MTQRLRKPLVELVTDINIRESLQWIYEYLIQVPILAGEFEHMEIDFQGAISNELIPHRLGFKPKDVIQTFVTGGATVTFNYDNFTETNLDITVSAPCMVRFLVGRYQK